jgi:hypothetical protein
MHDPEKCGRFSNWIMRQIKNIGREPISMESDRAPDCGAGIGKTGANSVWILAGRMNMSAIGRLGSPVRPMAGGQRVGI